MVTVSELAKPLARRPCCNEFDFSEMAPICSNNVPALGAEQVARDRSPSEVVVVYGDGLL